MAAPFLPGLELSRLFYAEAVRPLLTAALPGLPHSAARLGAGSEVLGFDTARSADHEWGPRLQVFLRPADERRHGPELVALLAARLPKRFRGYPTNFVPAENDRVRRMEPTDGPVRHRVDVTTVGGWFTGLLGFDPRAEPVLLDWLATPTQLLAEATAGAVFHDGLGELGPARARLAWYPPDLWRYVLARQWTRIGEEEAFVGRCGEVGDELGSAVVAARLVRELMRLCLLMARRYPPYGKWLGSAFARLPAAGALTPALAGALAAADWHTRERHLGDAYRTVAGLHNRLGLTEPLNGNTRPYHSRPFQVIGAGRFSAALLAGVTDPAVRALPRTGAVDQVADGTELLGRPGPARAAMAALLREPG